MEASLKEGPLGNRWPGVKGASLGTGLLRAGETSERKTLLYRSSESTSGISEGQLWGRTQGRL